MRLTTGIILCLWFCICSSSNVFRQPPGAGPTGDFRSNPTYVIGEILNIQWDSDDSSAAVTLHMIQASEESEPAKATIFSSQQTTAWNWRVSFDGFPSTHDRNLSKVYFFRLIPILEGGAGSTCHYFNITNSAVSSSVPSASSTSISVASTVMITATNTPKQDDNGLSGGAVAGIAIGATFGTLAVVGIAGFVFWMRWKNKKRERMEETADATNRSNPNEMRLHKRDVPPPLHELNGESTQRYEADGLEPSDMRFEMPGDLAVRK